MALQRKEYPILEFDPERSAVIEPHLFYGNTDAPRHCVITFFREVIEQKRAEGSPYEDRGTAVRDDAYPHL